MRDPDREERESLMRDRDACGEDEPLLSSGPPGDGDTASRPDGEPAGADRTVEKVDTDGPWALLDYVVDHAGFGWSQWKGIILASAINFSEAMNVSLMPLLFPLLKREWGLSNPQVALLGSSTAVGMLAGAILLGKSSDYVGRRPALLIGLVTVLIFGIAVAMSPSLTVMILLNLGVGIGYGGNILIANSYLAETLPRRVRGTALTSVGMFFGIGGMSTVAASFFVVPRVGWRWMMGAASLPIVPALIALKFAPESPRFLLSTGRSRECADALISICRDNGMLDSLPGHKLPTEKKLMLHPAQNSTPKTASDSSHTSSLASRLPSYRIMATLVPLAFVWLFNALGGNVYGWVPLYLSENTDLAASAQELMQYAYTAALLLAVGDTLGTLFVIGMFSLDVGRRILMFGMLLANAACLVGLGFLRSANQILLLLLVAKTCAGVTASLYVYTPEVFPTSFRVTGLVVCSTLHRIAPIVAPFAISALMDHLSFKHVACVFAALYAAGSFGSLLLPIETRGRAIVENPQDQAQQQQQQHPDDGILLVALCRHTSCSSGISKGYPRTSGAGASNSQIGGRFLVGDAV